MIQDIGSYTSIGESILYGADYKRIYSVRIDLITPEKAKEMLEKNVNRPLKTERVSQYTKDMKDGRWKINGVPIVITDDGYLKDGQHRLRALIKANMSFPFIVISYSKQFEEEASNYDIGLKRSVSDLRILQNKSKVSSRVIGAMNFILRYNSCYKSSSTICDEKIDENAEWLSILDKMTGNGKMNKAAYWAAIVTAYKNGYPAESLFEFNRVLQSGMMSSPEHSAIILLRNFLFELKGGGKQLQEDAYLKTQTALKYFYDKKSVQKLHAKEFYKWEDNNNERN